MTEQRKPRVAICIPAYDSLKAEMGYDAVRLAIYSAPHCDAMADFLCHVHAGLGRYVNFVRKRTGPVLAGRALVRPILADEKAQTDRLVYIMGQAVKAGVTNSVTNWAGANTNRALMFGEPVEGYAFDRHQQTLDKRLKDGPKEDAE